MGGYFNILVRVNFIMAKSSEFFAKKNDLLAR